MATLTDVSSPANGTAAVYTLLTELCAAGWIVKRWSDATTLSSDNVNLTTNPYGSSGSGAGNLGNTSAWFRVAASGGSREWLFQRGAGDATWTISRSVGLHRRLPERDDGEHCDRRDGAVQRSDCVQCDARPVVHLVRRRGRLRLDGLRDPGGWRQRADLLVG
jgi:hypothetical protein